MSYRVERLTSSEAINSLQDDWNVLAGRSPFLRWEWLGSWWNHYGAGHELYVLAVWDESNILVGLTPWYCSRRGPGGRLIQFLGSGKVCTDHLSILASPDKRSDVVTAVARFLLAAGHQPPRVAAENAWDQMELIGVDANDVSIRELASHLRTGQLTVEVTRGIPCYFLPLPATWDDYCKLRSKTGRRKARRSVERVLSGEFTVHQVKTQTELKYAWPRFIDLHQRRRASLGQKGCFDFPPFGDFLLEASLRMLEAGKLRMLIIEKGGHPVDIEYLVDDGEVLYFYQSGLDPDFIDEEPGNVTLSFCIFETIHQGYRGFDMMRGDEAYKARWRAEPVETIDVRAVARRPAAQLRHQAWNAAGIVKTWVKGGLEMAGWPDAKSNRRNGMHHLKACGVTAYYLATLPWRRYELGRRRRQGLAPLCILFYHRVADDHPSDWTISNRQFDRHVRHLQANYELISLDEIQRRLRGAASRRVAVSITFDDGYAENCQHALPLLIRKRIPCTYFVSLDHVVSGAPFPHDVAAGQPLPPNSPAQLKALATAGVEIGSHTRTHTDLGQVQDPVRLHDEVVAASVELAALTGTPIRYFAFPYGQPANLSAAAAKLAAAAGFSGVCSACGGYNLPGEGDFHLRRIHGDPELSRLRNWLTLDPRKLHAGRSTVLETELPRQLAEVRAR